MSNKFRAAGLSHEGRRRENNEDRFHVDAERSIYFVIDGVGGQAAGEKAAETAVNLIKARLERPTGSVAVRIREAITLANNEIWQLAKTNDDWHGMACVLTVAVVEDDVVHIGQVGDSRLYLIQPGDIRKLTHDHSPVGEREDRGELDELAAMRHPRRNEVYRDVGTTEHSPDDPDFIEITSSPVTPDSVLLLCSDGLSDLVPSKHILSIVEAHAGSPEDAAQALVAAANEAGGKDNVTAVVVEGPRFAAGVRRRQSSPRTSLPLAPTSASPFLSRWAFLVYGILLVTAAVWGLRPHWVYEGNSLVFGLGPVYKPRVWRVANDINSAIGAARAGDTILVAPGTYNEQIRLRDGVSVISEKPLQAVIRSTGVAVSGEDIKSGRIEGFRIQPDDAMFLQTGIQLTNSAADIVDNWISGTVTAGIELTASPGATVRASRVDTGSRAAIVVTGDGQGPRIVGNRLTTEGYPAIVITGSAKPVIGGNVLRAPEAVFAPPGFLDMKELERENFVVKPQVPASGAKPPAAAPRTNASPRIR